MDSTKALIKVQVFLSSYNGEKYIKQQVQSILEQKNVDVFLLIRDDGSTDKTKEILGYLKLENPQKIQIIEGNNLGYRKSFLSMLKYAKEDVNYFAYADQDDVWELDKLERASSLLSERSEEWLYASALKITDKNLNVLSVKDSSNLRQTLGSFFVRTRLAGCTMVFTRELEKIAEKYSQLNVDAESMPDHDGLICMLSMLYGKKIILDSQAHILHRRHEATETSGGRGIINRIKVECKRIFHRTNSYKYVASLLLNEPIMNSADENNNRDLLEKIANYDKSVISVVKLCFDSRIQCGIKIADILIRCKILLKKY